MTALFHRDHATPAPAVPCGADAYYWVTTPAGVQRLCCGPHLRQMLDQFRSEGGQVADLEPDRGTHCEFQGVTS